MSDSKQVDLVEVCEYLSVIRYSLSCLARGQDVDRRLRECKDRCERLRALLRDPEKHIPLRDQATSNEVAEFAKHASDMLDGRSVIYDAVVRETVAKALDEEAADTQRSLVSLVRQKEPLPAETVQAVKNETADDGYAPATKLQLACSAHFSTYRRLEGSLKKRQKQIRTKRKGQRLSVHAADLVAATARHTQQAFEVTAEEGEAYAKAVASREATVRSSKKKGKPKK